MLYELRKISNEQWFAIIAFLTSMILSFLFGYMVFRYWQIEVCKVPMEVVEQISDLEALNL